VAALVRNQLKGKAKLKGKVKLKGKAKLKGRFQFLILVTPITMILF
jgi:hypothetical protein